MKKLILFIVLLSFCFASVALAHRDGRGGRKGRVFTNRNLPANEQNTMPDVNDDITKGYKLLDIRLDESTGKSYICDDNAAGAADWNQIDSVGAASASDVGSITKNLDGTSNGGTSIFQSGGLIWFQDIASGVTLTIFGRRYQAGFYLSGQTSWVRMFDIGQSSVSYYARFYTSGTTSYYEDVSGSTNYDTSGNAVITSDSGIRGVAYIDLTSIDDYMVGGKRAVFTEASVGGFLDGAGSALTAGTSIWFVMPYNMGVTGFNVMMDGSGATLAVSVVTAFQAFA